VDHPLNLSVKDIFWDIAALFFAMLGAASLLCVFGAAAGGVRDSGPFENWCANIGAMTFIIPLVVSPIGTLYALMQRFVESKPITKNRN
jgi:hypothetical protein